MNIQTLKKIIFAVFLFSPIFYLHVDRVFADDTTPPTPVDQPISAIKAIIENGVVEYAKGVQKARIGLEWNPLPVSEALVNSLMQYKKADQLSSSVEINQGSSNSVLCNLDTQRKELNKALGLVENSDCRSINVDKDRQQRELDALFSGDGEGIKPSEYIAMSKERNILRTILSSRGIEYALNITNDGDLEVPEFQDKNITWQIKIHKYIWPSAPADLYYYRFNIKAIVKPIDKNVFNSQKAVDKIVKFDARIRIKDLNKQTSIPNDYFAVTNLGAVIPKLINQEPDPAIAKRIATEATTNFTSLSGIFSIIGGGQKLGVATQGLLGGNENSSFVSGGLLNFSNGDVDPVLGVNQEIGKIGDISAGVVFGVGLGERTTIFFGPSLQSSIFTISAGATLGAKEQSDLNFAGLVSVDLSRLSGNKTDVNTIKVDKNSIGDNSSIRTKIDAEAESSTLVQYQFTPDSSQKTSFELVRVCGADGKAISPISTVINLDGKNKVIYLKKGVYGYKANAGLSISMLNKAPSILVPIEADSPVDLREDITHNMTLSIKESAANTEEFVPKIKCQP